MDFCAKIESFVSTKTDFFSVLKNCDKNAVDCEATDVHRNVFFTFSVKIFEKIKKCSKM